MVFAVSYIDPGYGAGIDGVTCVENETYNPINGVAFTKVGDFDIYVPNLNTTPSVAFCRKLSVRFSVYSNAAPAFSVWVGANKGYRTDSISFMPHTSHKLAGGATNDFVDDGNGLSAGLHNIVFSIYVSVTSPGGKLSHIMTREIDGVTQSWNSTFDNVSYLKSDIFINNAVGFFITSNNCYISNIVIATMTAVIASEFNSAPLLTSEHLLVKLPLKNTSGDFISLGGGEYVGNTAGQKLLSVVDASDVITKFGASSKVSHLVSYGNPGYRVGSNITNATGISESDSSIAAHGSCSLSTDTDASAAVAWAVDNTRLSDVDGMKIGWQV